ncbi:MAG: prephenate dehydrogenase/arogenate dehydrogenase family protein [Bryobacteraceae bacterium]
METVAIVGVGLIGGSFARALRDRAGFRGRILGVSRPEYVTAAVAAGVVDEAASLESALAKADLVYLSGSISSILANIETVDRFVRNGTLITDAGSTKSQIMAKARQSIKKGVFIGGHPMAGKEVRGAEAADPNLFVGRNYFLCLPDSPGAQASNFVTLVSEIGAVPQPIAAEEHDRIVAYSSHLPQLASTVLAATVETHLGGKLTRKGAGSGIIDMTRLALSGYDNLWRDILDTNRAEVRIALDSFIETLSVARRSLDSDPSDPVREQFELGQKLAKDLRKRED